jgi:flagellar biosynthesis anti-sigma factor FlgM
MKIEVNYGSQAIADSKPTAGQNTRTKDTASSTVGEDEARLSGAHVQVAALAAQASQLPEVRQARVQALRQAIESGQYEASPEKVARAIMVHMMATPAV